MQRKIIKYFIQFGDHELPTSGHGVLGSRAEYSGLIDTVRDAAAGAQMGRENRMFKEGKQLL